KVENAIERLERMKDFETQMTSISEIEREENETASEKVAEVERQIIAPVPRRREDKRQAYPQDKNDAAIESQSTELVDSLAQMPIAEETLRDGEQAESKAQPEKPKFSAINYLSQKISKGKNKSRFEKIKKPP
ncbi:MAG: hypothetical protein NT051_04150, partial [Candidatus Micrarchaeota archaeon]|nr:hypothetical protein [Candidatus Micrarchaeota archaeon]